MSGSTNPQLLAAIMAALGGPTPRPSGAPGLARAALAQVAAQGRNGDTMLAHVNPAEAEMLKDKGGSGTINPSTGLPEFSEGGTGGDIGGGQFGGGEKGAATGFGGGDVNGSPQGVSGLAPVPEVALNPNTGNLGPNVGLGTPAKESQGFLGDFVNAYQSMSPPLGSVPGVVGVLASLLGGGPAITGAKGFGALTQALGGTPQSAAQKDAQTQAAMTAGGGGAGVAGGEGLYIDPALRQAMLYAGQQG